MYGNGIHRQYTNYTVRENHHLAIDITVLLTKSRQSSLEISSLEAKLRLVCCQVEYTCIPVRRELEL